MKNLFLTLTCILITCLSFGQGSLQNKEIQVNGGIGLSSFGLPIYAGLDYGVGKEITIGAEVSYRGYSDKVLGYYDNSYTIIGIGANGNYHFNKILDLPSKFDVYGGLTLNYYIWKNSSKYVGPANQQGFYTPNYAGFSGIGYGLQIGVRYFFTDKFGVNLEFGGGSLSGGKLGITYKLGGGKGSKRSRSSSNEDNTTKIEKKPTETVRTPEAAKTPDSKATTVKTTATKSSSTTTTTKKKTVTSTKKKITTKKKK